MLVRTLLFDHNQIQIAEIEPTVRTISWELNAIGQARFFFPFSDSKCTKSNLRYGNRVLFQFDDGLPDWGGVIDTPRTIRKQGVDVTAYSGEYLLAQRVTLQDRVFTQQLPGQIFEGLLQDAEDTSPLGIALAHFYSGGDARTREYHYAFLLEQCQELVRLSGQEFVVNAVIAGNGRIVFEASWHLQRGNDLSGVVWLLDGENVSNITILEQGPLANHCILAGQGSDWSPSRPVAISDDMPSRNDYGYREYAEVSVAVSDPGTLDADCNEILTRIAQPRTMVSLVASDKEPAEFALYGIGDTVRVQLLLSTTEWAFDANMRVVGREWRPDNSCRLELEEV
jgi:hypothetical protein